jgi:hypothetical protein
MKRGFAICVIALLLSGCGKEAAFENLADGPCTSAQAKLVNQHISGQIDALAEKDWELAFSYASPDFQKNVGIEQFTFIIGTQYVMLIENQGYRFNKCAIAGKAIMQEVEVTSGKQISNLTYSLSLNGSSLGVESAVERRSSTQLDT